VRGPEPRCPDCQVGIAAPHLDGCDVARCLATGQQRLCCWEATVDVHARCPHAPCADPSCDEGYHADPNHDCGQDRWSGFWPGVTDCNWHGWFITADSDFGRKFPDMVGTEDLNHHARICGGMDPRYRWDRDQRRVIRT
jgi:hypothetical protein